MTRLPLLCVLFSALPALAAESCRETAETPAAAVAGAPVTTADWLEPGNHRFGLANARRFVPAVSVTPPTSDARPFPAGTTPLDVDRLEVTDPADGSRRSLRFLLDNRIDADGVMVLRQGKLLLDYRRTGFDPEQPRLLLDTTRPILAALLARAVDENKISRTKAVSRVIPELRPIREMGKLSVQRVLNGRSGLQWSADDLTRWRREAGWQGTGKTGVRAWLAARGNWPRNSTRSAPDLGGPSGELLLWLNEKAWQTTAPKLLCDLQTSIKARHSAFWTRDVSGSFVADGLALSLEDFARLGQSLLDTRARHGARALAPAWFIEAIGNGGDKTSPLSPDLQALGGGSSWQYHFAHPGARGRRAAMLGSFGTSLFVDFDQGTVVAVFASNGAARSPLLAASLDTLWQTSRQAGGERERK